MTPNDRDAQITQSALQASDHARQPDIAWRAKKRKVVVHNYSQSTVRYHNDVRAKLPDSRYYRNSPILGGKVQPQNQPRRESDGEEDDHSLPDDRYMSSMRWFLDSNAAFEWPPDVGHLSGNHCHLKPQLYSPRPAETHFRQKFVY